MTLALGVSLATSANAQTVVTPVQTTTYTLNPANNPITFGAGSNINVSGAKAVSGGGGTTWNITVQGATAGQPAAKIFSYSGDGFTADGALVTNFGTISGGTNGIQVGGGSVLNGGTISGHNIYGVSFNNGGSVTNLAGGAIYGYYSAVRISSQAGTVTNAGRLTDGSNKKAAYLTAGGSITNLAGGYIQSAAIYGGPGKVTNAGVIGVVVLSNGTVTNAGMIGTAAVLAGNVTNRAGGLIGFVDGAISGVYGVSSGPVTVVNAGTIGTIRLQQGGSVTNQAGGTVSGGSYGGISIYGGAGTVTNAGAITGATGGASVEFLGTGANTLTLQTGSVLNGDAVGSTAAGATNALILQGTGNANNNFLNFNTLDVQASGLWALNGVSAIGATTVDAGTLVVGDAAHPGAQLTSPVTVNAGGVLAGQGTVTGNVTVASGGTIAPGAGAPFTSLQVNGNATFSPGSFFNVNINPAGQSDKLLLHGTANLAGGTVQVLAQPGLRFVPGTQYTILTSNGLGNTTFAGATSNVAFAFLTPSLSTDANDVFLTLARNATSFSAVAQTPNQSNVASALNAASLTNPLALSVLNQTVPGARQALDALSGEVYASLQNTLVDESQFMRNAMLGRLRQSSYAGAPGELGAFAFAGPELAYTVATADGGFPLKAPAKAASSQRDYTFWGLGLGGWGHVDGDGNAATLNNRFGGFISGVDALFGTIRAGFAAGYVRSDLDVSARSSSTGIDSGQFGLYAGSKAGPLNIRTGASYTIDTIDTSRTVAFPGLFEPTKADLTGNVGQVFGEVGHGLTFSHLALEPFAGLAYVNVHTGAFAENGGIAALAGSDNDESVGYSSLGLRTATIVPLANGTMLVPRLSAQWQYAFGGVTPQAALAFQSTGTAFSVAGVPIARNAALVDSGLDWRITSKMKVSLSYQGELADHTQTHTVKGGLSWNF